MIALAMMIAAMVFFLIVGAICAYLYECAVDIQKWHRRRRRARLA